MAAGVFRFSTDRFDAVPERENPHNPIRGEALLLWLRDRLAPDLDLAPPGPDDWGWYATLRCEGRAYTVGASGADEDEEGRRAAVTEWTVQVEKHRTGRSCSGAPAGRRRSVPPPHRGGAGARATLRGPFRGYLRRSAASAPRLGRRRGVLDAVGADRGAIRHAALPGPVEAIADAGLVVLLATLDGCLVGARLGGSEAGQQGAQQGENETHADSCQVVRLIYYRLRCGQRAQGVKPRHRAAPILGEAGRLPNRPTRRRRPARCR
jgi:hypothetical protein